MGRWDSASKVPDSVILVWMLRVVMGRRIHAISWMPVVTTMFTVVVFKW